MSHLLNESGIGGVNPHILKLCTREEDCGAMDVLKAATFEFVAYDCERLGVDTSVFFEPADGKEKVLERITGKEFSCGEWK